MSGALDRLAEAYGVELAYISETGERRLVSDATKRGVLHAMGIRAGTEDEIQTSLAAAPSPQPFAMAAPGDARCFVPGWLEMGRAWGLTCQLYGLRSQRNWGIGDFEDLAALAELAAGLGADFIGVSPLHALFLADPRRCSPYAPSSRLFLNPIYIAVDRLGAHGETVPNGVAVARASELVDYPAVARVKRTALENRFSAFCEHDFRARTERALAFEAFCSERGAALEDFAIYEALSEALVANGHPCGWHVWPDEYRTPDSGLVRRFAKENGARVLFHMWLQWVADEQLRDAQRRALAGGMRIGLYLDLAVGVAPDGAATWSDRELVVPGARIGSPPDAFNERGQDWGLAPLSPAALSERNVEPFGAVIAALMRHAGAIRIDHVMGLMRLYWIPANAGAMDGAYVRYPMPEMMRQLAAASVAKRALVIGEDLGTVPPGFRQVMQDAEIQGYRVLYFERREDQQFRAPPTYPREACACISTHDLPTLAGWWRGTDIDVREQLGRLDAEGVARQRTDRARDRHLLLAALHGAGLLPSGLERVAKGEEPPPRELPVDAVTAAHVFLARTPSRLIAVQLEDLIGAVEQANLPGTVDEHPNWRRKLPVGLEEIAATLLFNEITSALARERPRHA
jgi:4-alpha-glucanotransferase